MLQHFYGSLRQNYDSGKLILPSSNQLGFGSDKLDPITFLFEVVTLSASGALAPGPLTAAAIEEGLRGEGWRSGIMMALGHSVVEFPLILALAFGFARFLGAPAFKTFAGVAGGVVLLVLGFLQIKEARKARLEDGSFKEPFVGRRRRRSFWIGLSLTALNPFFIAWWLTVGIKLIYDSTEVVTSKAGPFLLFFLHIWLDYAWLSLLAHASNKGVRLLGEKSYRAILFLLGMLLLYFGMRFLWSTIVTV